MAGRIPMKGDPKPLGREELARDLQTSVPRIHEEAKRMLAEAEASGNRTQIEQAQALLRQTQELMRKLGLEP